MTGEVQVSETLVGIGRLHREVAEAVLTERKACAKQLEEGADLLECSKAGSIENWVVANALRQEAFKIRER